MIRRLLGTAAAPAVAVLATGPVLDRIATRLTEAPRRLPEETGMVIGLDAMGGEVVRLRARDGVRLTGRWLGVEPGAADAPSAGRADTPAGDVPDPTPWVADPHEAILLLHGWSGSVTPDLIELAPFLRRTAGVLGLDFRGHGGSEDAPTTFGLHEVEDVAGALAWLGERGVTRVALMGSSMGGIVALAAVAVLGDGRLPAADIDPDATASPVDPPRPRVVAVVGDSVTPELWVVVASRLGFPFGRLVAQRALGRMARRIGGDPRRTEPIRVVGLLEDLPLLLIHGGADRTVPVRDARRLAAAAPPGMRHLVIDDAGHAEGHRVDPERYEAEVTGLLRAAFVAARG